MSSILLYLYTSMHTTQGGSKSAIIMYCNHLAVESFRSLAASIENYNIIYRLVYRVVKAFKVNMETI